MTFIDVKKFVCDKCGKEFNNNYIPIEWGEYSFKGKKKYHLCPKCEKKFKLIFLNYLRK